MFSILYNLLRQKVICLAMILFSFFSLFIPEIFLLHNSVVYLKQDSVIWKGRIRRERFNFRLKVKKITFIER